MTFTPDLARFGMSEIDDDIISLLKKRVYDLAGTTKGVAVTLNGERLKYDHSPFPLYPSSLSLYASFWACADLIGVQDEGLQAIRRPLPQLPDGRRGRRVGRRGAGQADGDLRVEQGRCALPLPSHPHLFTLC